MSIILHSRAVSSACIAMLLMFGCSSPASSDPGVSMQEWPEIIIGQPLHRALVAACVTREQAESVVKVHSEKGAEAAEKAFLEQGCFVLYMNLVPRALVSSRRVGERMISVVGIAVRSGLVSQHVIYMITPNPVVLGTRV
jgi:hypothetical protein